MVPMSSDPARDTRDRETFQGIHQGDARAFESLFLAYAGPLIAYARTIVHDTATAEELVQEVFLYLWANRTTLDVTTSVRAYLYTSARNRALNYRRHEQLEQETISRFDSTDEHPEMSQGAADTAASLSDAELGAAIERAIERLPRRTREVLRLRWYHHLTQSEIAETLGVSIKTVESQMRNAFHAMRRELQRFRE